MKKETFWTGLLVLGIIVVPWVSVAVGQEAETGAPSCAGEVQAAEGQAVEGQVIEISDVELTEVERKLVRYLVEHIAAGNSPEIDGEQLERELGLSEDEIKNLDQVKLQSVVMSELQRLNIDLGALGGNCSRFSACSVDRNLSNASGEELARYEQEVSEDGSSYSGRMAPDFALPDAAGNTITLSDYRGRNVALVFLSMHCFHSLDTLPILQELTDKYGKDVAILPVFINSGDVEQVASRAWELDFELPLIVSEGKEISDAYDSRMVPSTFLIDEKGRLTKKLVGFKNKETLDLAIGELIRT